MFDFKHLHTKFIILSFFLVREKNLKTSTDVQQSRLNCRFEMNFCRKVVLFYVTVIGLCAFANCDEISEDSITFWVHPG